MAGHTTLKVSEIKSRNNSKHIAFLQCVGSRDKNRCGNGYCSSVCCMYAIKEAVIAKEHAGDDLECTVFYMDMRTHGKDFERFYNNAQEKGVRFVRSRVHTIDPVAGSDDLSVRYVTDSGELQNETFDQVVLSIGLQTDPEVKALAEKLDIDLTAEMTPRQVVGDLAKIMMAPVGPQGFLSRAAGHKTRAILFHESVDRACGPPVAVAQVVADRV